MTNGAPAAPLIKMLAQAAAWPGKDIYFQFLLTIAHFLRNDPPVQRRVLDAAEAFFRRPEQTAIDPMIGLIDLARGFHRAGHADNAARLLKEASKFDDGEQWLMTVKTLRFASLASAAAEVGDMALTTASIKRADDSQQGFGTTAEVIAIEAEMSVRLGDDQRLQRLWSEAGRMVETTARNDVKRNLIDILSQAGSSHESLRQRWLADWKSSTGEETRLSDAANQKIFHAALNNASADLPSLSVEAALRVLPDLDNATLMWELLEEIRPHVEHVMRGHDLNSAGPLNALSLVLEHANDPKKSLSFLASLDAGSGDLSPARLRGLTLSYARRNWTGQFHPVHLIFSILASFLASKLSPPAGPHLALLVRLLDAGDSRVSVPAIIGLLSLLTSHPPAVRHLTEMILLSAKTDDDRELAMEVLKACAGAINAEALWEAAVGLCERADVPGKRLETLEIIVRGAGAENAAFPVSNVLGKLSRIADSFSSDDALGPTAHAFIANGFGRKKESHRSVEEFQKALTSIEKIDDEDEKAAALNAVAFAVDADSPSAVDDILKQASAMADALSSPGSRASALAAIAGAHGRRNNFATASTVVDRAFDAANAIPVSKEDDEFLCNATRARVIADMALASASIKDSTTAGAILEKTAALSAAISDSGLRCAGLQAVAEAAGNLSSSETANAILLSVTQGLWTADAVEDNDKKMRAVREVAKSHVKTGVHAQASAVINKALTAIERMTGLEYERCESLRVMIPAIALLDASTDRLALLKKALAMAGALGDGSQKSSILTEAARGYVLFAAPSDALAVVQTAIDVIRRTCFADPEDYERSEDHVEFHPIKIAQILRTANEPQLAAALLDETVRVVVASPLEAGQKSAALAAVAVAFGEAKEFGRAHTLLTDAFRHAEESPDDERRAAALLALGQAWADVARSLPAQNVKRLFEREVR